MKRAAFILILALPALAAPVRHHGFQLDERHRLFVEEVDGFVTVSVLIRARGPGGPPIDDDTVAAGRYGQRRTLVRVRSEVLKPAAPNYLRNPGQRYRIVFDAVAVVPGYALMRELDAPDARPWLDNQFELIRAQASGIDRTALWFAPMLVLGLLNEAGRMPAFVPQSIRRSGVGRTRGLESLERKGLARGPEAEGEKTPAETPEKRGTARLELSPELTAEAEARSSIPRAVQVEGR
jgi:hypothetical protein